jgi:thiamine-monophosphate kinase
MVEGVDFRLDWRAFDFRLLGRRLMAINLSDLAAMGAEPRHALISLCLRPRVPVASITALYRGIGEQARRYGFTVAGGDLSRIDGPLVLSATLVGEIREGRPMRRSGARPGWLLAVTGVLGNAAAGLELLQRRRRPSTSLDRRLIRAQLDPVARVLPGQILRASGIRVAGDISDGLAGEVLRIAQASQVQAVIFEAGFPFDPALRAEYGDRKARLLALQSEDYELICAAPRHRIKAASERLRAETGVRLEAIGFIRRGRGVLRVTVKGKIVDIRSAGYEHFG